MVLLLVAILATTTMAADYLEQDIALLRKANQFISRQLQMQQNYLEERVRTDGASGIKRLRIQGKGSNSMYTNGHSDESFMGMHNHPNLKNRVGLSAFEAALNGIEFTTTENDYPLRSPHSSEDVFLAAEDVEHPPVPESVRNKTSVEEQIEEMKMYFKAFKAQDWGIRDYRPYFKPLLCYLEGYWSEIENVDTDEYVKRSSRFMAHSGLVTEDYSYLPTKLMNIVNDTTFVFGQWNYRILCHQLGDDLAVRTLRLEDDLPSRIAFNQTLEEYGESNRARFTVCPYRYGSCADRTHEFVFLDELVGQIPGMNNYGSTLRDTLWEDGFLNFNRTDVLNAAQYHRWFSAYAPGAMGSTKRHRAFADETMFMALTNKPQVAGMVMWNGCSNNPFSCTEEYYQKWSYMFPLEIIYLNPLYNWNPYEIAEYGDTDSLHGTAPTSGGRNGGFTPETAYNGTNDQLFYRTPSSFFSSEEINPHPKDTGSKAVGVLDKHGVVQSVVGSGVRIFLPNITDVGVVRQRYPIAPLHNEYGHIWKEVSAVQDMVDMRYQMDYTLIKEDPKEDKLTLVMVLGRHNETSPPHTHYIFLDKQQTKTLKQQIAINVTTEAATFGDNHVHHLTVNYVNIVYALNSFYTQCDGQTLCHHQTALGLQHFGKDDI